ncbi:hypothetical protein HOLleu_16955 [Holothuria leucospilota]|uniref:Uncharacterized protein n=1 Tax=Holothuria leucospilota TaxID=206669 RepID=A0A9Q1C6X9_HOLLE|nr:hypothetical protein HOLleu_16955 [Holothuria leucospilota]
MADMLSITWLILSQTDPVALTPFSNLTLTHIGLAILAMLLVCAVYVLGKDTMMLVGMPYSKRKNPIVFGGGQRSFGVTEGQTLITLLTQYLQVVRVLLVPPFQCAINAELPGGSIPEICLRLRREAHYEERTRISVGNPNSTSAFPAFRTVQRLLPKEAKTVLLARYIGTYILLYGLLPECNVTATPPFSG